MALGLIEVFGFTTSIVVADAVAKAADVTIVALDKNKPANGDAAEVPLLMTIKFEGDVAAVEAGMGVALAESRGLLVTSHMISRQEADTEKMARINALGKDKLNTAYLEEYDPLIGKNTCHKRRKTI